MAISTIRAERNYPRSFADDEADVAVVAPERDRWWTISGAVSFLASASTAFTVSLVGEMPVGEFLLFAAAGWALLCFVFNHAAPGRLFHSRLFWWMMVAQLVALIAYVASDIYRHSAPRDMARGWGRM